MNNTKEIQNKKINARIYPIYKALSWDLLFYYSIIYLFLTQAKNFTASQVLISEAFFSASCLLLQVPIGVLVEKRGKKKSLVFANICLSLFMIILIFTQNYAHLLIAFFIDAVGYVIKGVCETNILYDSLPTGKKRGSLYSTIDGAGASTYYVIDAITSIVAGFTFAINPYIPMTLCLIGNVTATILSMKFKSINNAKHKEKKEKISIKKYFDELNDAFDYCKNSKRMICLLIFFALVSGLTYNMTTFRSGILAQIEIPSQYFGLIFAASQLVASIASRYQSKINRKLKNKTLACLGIPYTVICIIIGFFANDNKAYTPVIMIVLLFVLQGGIKGAYNVLIYRYLNNFTNRNVRVKLATIRSIIYGISNIIISLIGALLLSITSASNTLIVVGCITTIIMILLLDYMRGRVGLKPDQYNIEDLKYSNLIKDEVKNK